MDKEKILRERHDLLLAIQDELQEDMIAASLMKGGVGDDTDVLRVVFPDIGFENEDGGIGEFFFAPFTGEEDTVTHFVSAITIADDYSTDNLENLQNLGKLMLILNCYLPCGCFCVNRDARVLLYKLVTPLPVDLTAEALKEQVNICIGNAVAVCDQYSDFLCRVIDGEMEPNEVFEVMGI